MNWTDCELAKRCSTFHTFGCLSGIRLAATPARGTEKRRGATWTCLASGGFQRVPLGLWPIFQREWQWPVGPRATVASTGICVSKSAFGPGSMTTAGSKSERREEASKGRAICGRGNHWVWLLAGVALQVR